MAEISGDPFSAVYDSLWDCLEARSDFTDIVPVGNRIRYDGDARDPEKQIMATADHPQVRIDVVAGVPNLHETSNSSKIIDTYIIRASTGDKRINIDAGLGPVRWSILRGILGWKTILTALTWNSVKFVIDVDVVSTDEQIDRGLEGKGTEGWSTVITLEVRQWFNTNAMEA